MGYDQRSEAWLRWMANVRAALLQTPFGAAPEEARRFFAEHWTTHMPLKFQAPWSPAMNWTLPYLRSVAGELEVEVHANRSSTEDYELHAVAQKARMPFGAFLDQVEHGTANDVYLTARNAAGSSALIARLAPDLLPLPVMLRQEPSAAFLWCGTKSVTPLHTDHTCNMLVQLMGSRTVRLLPPSEQPRLENHIAVFSRLRWAEDVEARGLVYQDVVLNPGDALFIPVGWWHTVNAHGVSAMASFTNFWWPNYWTEGFPS